jgi:peptidyl-prolyl cis-trans isomerase SurA
MKRVRHVVMIGLLTLGLVAIAAPVRAELVEEIIAWVNGDIITWSEYQGEEQARTAEAYQQFTGEELDRMLEKARSELLLAMIDRKILLHHAQALGYDMPKMSEAYTKAFMQQQQIANEDELRRLAEGDGMTLKQVKDRLLELYAPQDIIDMEVINRISVSDREIEAFYLENQEDLRVAGEVTLREIVLLADNDAVKEQRRDEARRVWERASSGEDFSTLAQEVSEAGTSAGGGKFGPLKRTDLSENLVGPAFTLPVGGVSELMETPYGFHIITVESRMDDRALALDDVKDNARKILEDRKFRAELEAFMEKARSESEWCVKPKHAHRLSIEVPPPCERL